MMNGSNLSASFINAATQLWSNGRAHFIGKKGISAREMDEASYRIILLANNRLFPFSSSCLR